MGNDHPSPVGGFFELEKPTAVEVQSPHPGALALNTGRACLNLILDSCQPEKCHVPAYTCAEFLTPFTRRGIELCYYHLDRDFEPLDTPQTVDSDLFFYINYFGIKDSTVARLIEHLGSRLVIDNTHAFFNRGYRDNWSFTSALWVRPS